MLGHNNPPSAMQEFQDDIDKLSKVVDKWRESVPTIEHAIEATSARDLIARIIATAKSVEAARVAEKKPHMDAAREIDRAYRPLSDTLDLCNAQMENLIRDWLRRERARLAREESAARECARIASEVAAQKAAEAAREGSIAAIMEASKAAAAADAASEAAREAGMVRPSIVSNYGVRRQTLREHWYARVVDSEKAALHYHANLAIINVLEKLASAEARAGARTIPGCEIASREVVA